MNLKNEISLGWVDFTDDGSLSDFFKVKKNVESRDPLDISDITKYYADKFFPGIVTQLTRAKYYVLVPYALLELEEMVKSQPEKYTTTKEIRETLEHLEKKQRDALCRNSKKGESFPGNRNKGGSFRFPSDDYWASLRKFGILKLDCSKSKYLSILKDISTTPEERWDIIDLYNSYKQAGIKAGKESIELLKINLTKDEKAYLFNCFKTKAPDSPFAEILEMSESSIETKNYIIDRLTASKNTDMFLTIKEICGKEKYVEDFNVALAFSEFVYVLNIVYNLRILKNKKDAEELWNKIDNKRLIEIATDLDVDKLPLENGDKTKMFLTDAKKIMLTGEAEKDTIRTQLDKLVIGHLKEDINHNIKSTDKWKGQVKPDFYSGTAARIILDLIGG